MTKSSWNNNNNNNNNIIPTSEPTKQNFFTSPLNYLNDIAINFLIRILRNGPIPKHIGFIMDGNRRFAKKMKWQTKEGHYKGFSGLINVINKRIKIKKSFLFLFKTNFVCVHTHIHTYIYTCIDF